MRLLIPNSFFFLKAMAIKMHDLVKYGPLYFKNGRYSHRDVQI